MLRRLNTLAAGTVLGALAAAAPLSTASADTINLRIGAGHPETATWITTIREFFMPALVERVGNETDHEIQWTEAWGGSVCKLGECLEAVEAGLLDMADLQTPFDPSKLMAYNFSYFVPFGTCDSELGAELNWQTYQDVPELKTVLEEQYNQVFVGVGILGCYGLVTNFTWDDPAELRGQKIAAAGPNIPWVEAVGVVPVQSNLNEAYTAMQTGVYNGWVMFPDGATAFRLEEVSQQYTITGFGVIATPLLTINKDAWDALPEEVQQIMLEVGESWNRDAGEFTERRQHEALETMKAAGLEIKELTFEEKQAWAEQLPNIPQERAEEAEAAGQPGEAIYRYVELLKEAGHEFPRDWAAER